ncbi:cation diffusion facilitator family transporter [Candidatus Methanomassiliicoccus intestinalis]|jgi:cation diffusion facilitator family transporter|uniref:Cation diffusion facilitator family transporter n=1 Tax=Candidatus Methanomassiliicoccus intestinalis TaxID=1406512 RepID=A0A8J8PDP1_9ARCH|nr:MAG: hypothetical protein A3207_08740 [Candidatus Methanomassiliicoccus intestinalis]
MDKRHAAGLAVAGGIAVFLIKAVAFGISGSVALLSDALESIVNIAASIMMLVSVHIALKPADENHKYGHYKAENISCFIEGVLVLIAAVLIFWEAAQRLLSPIEPSNLNYAIVVSLIATAINGIMALVLLRTSRASGSIALEGDAKHLFSDVVSSGGVVLGLAIASVTGLMILDPLIAMVVAVLLVKMAYDILKKTAQELMDCNCPDEEKIIDNVLSGINGYIEYHDLKTRRTGNTIYAEFHLCVDGKCTLAEAHHLTDIIEEKLKNSIPGLSVMIHVETEEEIVHPLHSQ